MNTDIHRNNFVGIRQLADVCPCVVHNSGGHAGPPLQKRNYPFNDERYFLSMKSYYAYPESYFLQTESLSLYNERYFLSMKRYYADAESYYHYQKSLSLEAERYFLPMKSYYA